MSHDASGGVDGDGLLLDWLLVHGFRPGSCRGCSGCVGGVGEQSVEKGPSLGRGEDGWCGVGVGGRDCHDGRMQVRWGAGLGREGEKRE